MELTEQYRLSAATVCAFLFLTTIPQHVASVDAINFEGISVKNLKLHAQKGLCALYDSVSNQDRLKVLRLLSQESLLVNTPNATFFDYGDEIIHAVEFEGIIRLFESSNHNDNEIPEESITLAAIMAIFVEQEIEKNKGKSQTGVVVEFI